MKKIISFLFVLAAASTPAYSAPTNAQLNIGIEQEFETLNPVIHQMSASTVIMYAATHPLVSLDADWKWKCYLCVDIPTLENGKARFVEESGVKKIAVDWEIKPNAKWGDGEPVTGHDVKLGWEAGGSPNVAVGEKEQYTNIERIDVDPKDPKKFSMTYRLLRYDFASLGTFYILPDHIERAVWEKTKNVVGEYERQTRYATDPTNPGLYSGPYRVTEISLGSHVILERNPHYYGSPAKIAKLVYKLIPDTATLEANLVSGTIDMVSEMGFTLDQSLAFEKRLGRDASLGQKYKVLYRDGMQYEHIDLNLRNPVLQDIRVRQALLFAIDRDKLTQALFEGKQKKALHFTHPLDPYYTEDVMAYPYDPAKAAALLDEAGWKTGPDGFRYKDGKKLSLPFMTTAQNKVRELVQVYLQGEWKKLGVDTPIKNEPARVFFGETVRKGAYPALAMFTWSGSPDNPPRYMLHSSQIPAAANGYSGQNSGGWSDKVVDELFDKVIVEFDAAKRKEMMKTIMQEYVREVPTIPLYNRVEIAVIPSGLKGFTVTGTQFYSSLSAEYWTME